MTDWNGVDRRLIRLLRIVNWDDPVAREVMHTLPACSDHTLKPGDPVVFTGPEGDRIAGVLQEFMPCRDDLPNLWACVSYVSRVGKLALDMEAPAYYVLRRHTPHAVDELLRAKGG